MNCENYATLIDDLVENELDEQTADRVSLHLVDCENCTAKFELLEREKAIYSHYLFEVEPPADMLVKFQIRLEAEKPTIWAAYKGFFLNIFAFLRFNPALVAATIISVFAVGFTLFNLVKEKQSFERVIAVTMPTGLPTFQPSIINSPGPLAAPDEKKNNDKENAKPVIEPNPKPIVIKHPLQNKVKIVPPINKPNEENQEIAEIRSFEIETAKQLEKVELLLRSFRNARMIEGSEVYDVSYEKQQARKLLQNNFALRQKAGVYGTMFAEDMLSKVEPYLLDIANLDLDSSPEQILQIKERVKNQKIIASLQGF